MTDCAAPARLHRVRRHRRIMPLIRFAHGAEEIDRLDFECVFVREDVGRAAYFGLDGLRTAWLDWLSPWDSYNAWSRRCDRRRRRACSGAHSRPRTPEGH